MKVRNIIFWVHLIAGVLAGVIIFIMSLTGAMLAFRGEIIDIAEQDVRRVTPPVGQDQLSVNTLMAKVQDAYPDRKPKSVLLKSDPTASVSISFGRDDGHLYVNGYTGDILGQQAPAHVLLDQVESWHRWLAMEGKLKPLGHNIKGVANMMFLVMILTGFYLWWPRKLTWKIFQANTQFNSKLKGNARDWNWHNVIGFWSAPFLIVITLTGLIMSYKWANNLLYRLAGSEVPVAMVEGESPKKMDKSDGKKDQAIDFDSLISKAKLQVPQWRVMNVRFQKPGAPVTILIEDHHSGNVPERSQLILDASTAEIIKWEPSEEQSLGRKLRTLVRYTHTGEAGGLIGKLFACVASCAALVLVWTGLAMSWRRFFILKKL